MVTRQGGPRARSSPDSYPRALRHGESRRRREGSMTCHETPARTLQVSCSRRRPSFAAVFAWLCSLAGLRWRVRSAARATLQDEEDRVLLAELEAHDWPTVPRGPVLQGVESVRSPGRRDLGRPDVEAARRTIDGSSSSGLPRGRGAGSTRWALEAALAEAMEAVVSAVNGEQWSQQQRRVESRTQVEGSLAGFTFESMSTYSESTDPETGKSPPRWVLAVSHAERRGTLLLCAGLSRTMSTGASSSSLEAWDLPTYCVA